MTWPDRMMAAGAFLMFFGGYLFSRGPAANTQQLAFRIGVFAVGVVLSGVGLILRLSSKGKSV